MTTLKVISLPIMLSNYWGKIKTWKVIIKGRVIVLTNEHYKYFLRLNNRKKSHYVREYVRHKYPIIEIPRNLIPINQELIDWLNQNIGPYSWTSDQYRTIALTSDADATFFQLTWGGTLINKENLTRYM